MSTFLQTSTSRLYLVSSNAIAFADVLQHSASWRTFVIHLASFVASFANSTSLHPVRFTFCSSFLALLYAPTARAPHLNKPSYIWICIVIAVSNWSTSSLQRIFCFWSSPSVPAWIEVTGTALARLSSCTSCFTAMHSWMKDKASNFNMCFTARGMQAFSQWGALCGEELNKISREEEVLASKDHMELFRPCINDFSKPAWFAGGMKRGEWRGSPSQWQYLWLTTFSPQVPPSDVQKSRARGGPYTLEVDI
jgi:hypothetical protein